MVSGQSHVGSPNRTSCKGLAELAERCAVRPQSGRGDQSGVPQTKPKRQRRRTKKTKKTPRGTKDTDGKCKRINSARKIGRHRTAALKSRAWGDLCDPRALPVGARSKGGQETRTQVLEQRLNTLVKRNTSVKKNLWELGAHSRKKAASRSNKGVVGVGSKRTKKLEGFLGPEN